MRRIQENALTEVLNAVPVHKGDVFFIPSGTIHAICKGIVIAEIQQNSNVTYRVYDYGRLEADGKPRTLHINQALAVTNLSPTPRQNFGQHLGACRYFTTDAHTGESDGIADETSFVSLLVTDGNGTLEVEGQRIPLSLGDSIFICAGSGIYHVSGDCQILETRV